MYPILIWFCCIMFNCDHLQHYCSRGTWRQAYIIVIRQCARSFGDVASLWIRWAHREICQVSSLAHGHTQAHIQVCVHIHYMQIHRRYSGCVCAVWRIPGIFSSLLLALHDDWFCKRFIIRYNMIFLFFLKTCLHAHTHTHKHSSMNIYHV